MQIEMNYGDEARIRDRCERVRGVVREIAAVEGVKELAYAADMRKSHVSEALDGAKSMPSKLEQAAMLKANEELRVKLAEAMVGSYYKPERKLPLTPEEREKRIREAMERKLGSVGEEIIREALER